MPGGNKYSGWSVKVLVNKQHWAVGRLSVREQAPGIDVPDSEGRPGNVGQDQKPENSYAITGTTNASPCVVTVGTHSMVINQFVTVTGTTHLTPGVYQIVAVGMTTISLTVAAAPGGTDSVGTVFPGGVQSVGTNAVVPGVAKVTISLTEPTWDGGQNPFATPFGVELQTYDMLQVFIDGNTSGPNYWLFYSALLTGVSDDGDVQRDLPLALEYTSDGAYVEPNGATI